MSNMNEKHIEEVGGKPMNIHEKHMHIQEEVKAPKNQKNTHVGYKFRSAEDILEAAKPICHKYFTTIELNDEIVLIGDRYYVKATATLTCTDSGNTKTATAYAREAELKRGLDEAQVTGTASSYARKYAMNGLFALDDTKDADTNEYAENAKKAPSATQAQIKELTELFTDDRLVKLLEHAKCETLADLTIDQASDYIRKAKKHG